MSEEQDILRMMYEPNVVLCMPKECIECGAPKKYYLRGGAADKTDERVPKRLAEKIIARSDVIRGKSANFIIWQLAGRRVRRLSNSSVPTQ